MEEVWMVYLCLILLVLVYILMNRKPDDEIKSEKEPGAAPASSSYSSGSVGRHLECTEEELEQSLERLVGVFSKTDARKREAPHDHGASTQQRESSGRGPQLSQSSIQEKPSHPKSHESLVNEIEQAVQETVDADAYVRRRQAQPAPRSHREVQRSEVSERF